VVEDDHVEVSVSLRNIGFRELGVSKKDIRRMGEDEEGILTFEGIEYELETSGTCTYHKDSDRESVEDFDYWEFESEDGTTLSVASWDDGSWDASLAVSVRLSQVKLFSLG
jgi:hypothetical protein